ncbi:uncharacterized protein [Elaeis guineensis]|uniref:Uncharacterized protein LOC105041427 n=1 Tax=Elaeis guineensis var. tenera TaxID=51953 RepID=A0A6I9QX64_ELAGV|nr:uncharacterized protein LOC105041427 [Elaeis guineensis]
MAMAPSLAASEFSNLHAVVPCKSLCYASKSSLLWMCRSSRRKQRVKLSVQSPGPIGGEPHQKTDDNMETSNQPPIEQPANSSPPLPTAPNWLKWTLGSIMWLALPSWKKIQKIDDVVTKVDNVVEMIEDVAEVTEKIASHVAEGLPEDGMMRKAMEGLENASEEVLKKVEVIDKFVDKVDEWTEKLKIEDEQGDQDKHGEKNNDRVE